MRVLSRDVGGEFLERYVQEGGEMAGTEAGTEGGAESGPRWGEAPADPIHPRAEGARSIAWSSEKVSAAGANTVNQQGEGRLVAGSGKVVVAERPDQLRAARR